MVKFHCCYTILKFLCNNVVWRYFCKEVEHISPELPYRLDLENHAQNTREREQPPTNLAASPPPTICPDGSTPDTNGNCPQVGQGDTSTKHHKGNELSQQTPSSTDNRQQVEKTSKGNKAINSVLRGSGNNDRKGGRYLASP